MIEWLREVLARPVADPREARLRRRFLYLFAVDAILALALVWMQLMVQQAGYRLDKASRLIEKLDLEHTELLAEYSRETSPERLRERARAELGLDLPEPGQVMAIDGRP